MCCSLLCCLDVLYIVFGLMDVSMSSVIISAVCLRCVLVAVFALVLVCLCLTLVVFKLCIPILNLYASIEHAILLFSILLFIGLVYLFGVEIAISNSLSSLFPFICFCSLFSLGLLFIFGFWFFPLLLVLLFRCVPARWFLS